MPSPAVVKDALSAIEDARFFDHNGLDVQGTARALVKNIVAGAVEEGGSTLTQQLVKQTLLQTADGAEAGRAAIERSVARKLREARLALALEDLYCKDELLTRYLNIVYFGRNAYGVQSAAQAFFGVDASDLTLPRPALLAGIVQSPSDHDPVHRARERDGPTQPGPRPHGRPGYITPRRRRPRRRRRRSASTRAGAPDAGACRPSWAPTSATSCSSTSPRNSASPTTARARRLHDPHDPRHRPAEVRRPRRARHARDGPAAGRHVQGRGAGHRSPAAMSVNREFGFDRTDPNQESYNLNRASQPGVPTPPTRSSSRPRRWLAATRPATR